MDTEMIMGRLSVLESATKELAEQWQLSPGMQTKVEAEQRVQREKIDLLAKDMDHVKRSCSDLIQRQAAAAVAIRELEQRTGALETNQRPQLANLIRKVDDTNARLETLGRTAAGTMFVGALQERIAKLEVRQMDRSPNEVAYAAYVARSKSEDAQRRGYESRIADDTGLIERQAARIRVLDAQLTQWRAAYSSPDAATRALDALREENRSLAERCKLFEGRCAMYADLLASTRLTPPDKL